MKNERWNGLAGGNGDNLTPPPSLTLLGTGTALGICSPHKRLRGKYLHDPFRLSCQQALKALYKVCKKSEYTAVPPGMYGTIDPSPILITYNFHS